MGLFFKQVDPLAGEVAASVYDRAFYRELKTEKLSGAVKYFAKLILMISFLISILPIFGGLGLYFWNKDKVGSVREQITAVYPAELELRIRNGQVASNVTEPYAVALPDEWKMEQKERKRTIENFVLIDTTKSITADDFEAYATAVIIGKDEIGFLGDKNEIQIHKLNDWDIDYIVTQNAFEGLVGRGFEIVRIAGGIILALLPFLIFSGLFVWYLIYLFFGALFVWLAAKLHKLPFTYGESYRYGLHLLTLPVILSLPLGELFHVPFLFTIALFATAYWNLKPETIKPAETIITALGDKEKSPGRITGA